MVCYDPFNLVCASMALFPFAIKSQNVFRTQGVANSALLCAGSCSSMPLAMRSNF